MYRKGEVSCQPIPLAHRVEMCEPEVMAAAADFLGKMRTRHSVRHCSTRPVPEALITSAIAAAGTALSGANHQKRYFEAISNREMKARVHAAAEAEEREFYAGGAGDAWLAAPQPIGTRVSRPHLTDALGRSWPSPSAGGRPKTAPATGSAASCTERAGGQPTAPHGVFPPG